ncbi:hypothetical protein C6495_14420 [Candidatus Poribacteria bacterium]|nr:MAG: hypothetical protein C6495_14420 [Candidatus Poribacteria bacterium]
MAVSSLPGSSEIEPVLLELLGDGKEWRNRDFVDALAAHYSLTPEQLAEKLPSGRRRFYERCNFAKEDMRQAGFVESPRRGYWRITKRGLDVLAGIVPPFPYWRNWKPPKRG